MDKEQIKKRLDLLEAIEQLTQHLMHFGSSDIVVTDTINRIKDLAEEIAIDDLED